MSRIGKLPINVPENVTILIENGTIEVKGPKATLTQEIPNEINVELINKIIHLTKKHDTRIANQKYGLTRSLINNMLIGVDQRFEKRLQMIGVGYKAQVQGKELKLNVGYSHPISFVIPEGTEIIVEGNSNVILRGPDKNLVGLLAAQIRATRPPEPYKGKGVRYFNEFVVRKAGKSGK
jgi:large subunit ribosomal protein L6